MTPTPHRADEADRPGRFLVVPIAAVTCAAMFGQVGFFHDEATDPDWHTAARWGLALWIAATIESVSLYIGWHAHDALIRGHAAAAARRRRAAYGIAAVVAGINYWHFSDNGHPTPLAVTFALLSALSPWLWGMHSRRARQIQLVAEGGADNTGAQLDPSKWKHYPLQAWGARRYSVLHNITDPERAWAAYQADREASRARREAVRAQRRQASVRRAVASRIAGAVAASQAGATGGATAGATGGAKPGAKTSPAAGVTGGVTPVRPATPAPVPAAPERGAATRPAALHAVPARHTTPSDDGPVLQEAAAKWALAQEVKTGTLPGWRPILDEFGPRGLTEYRAKEAAKAAKARAAGSAKATVGGQAVVIRGAR